MKSIGYILADFPVLSETFIGDEIRAMKDKGHEIIPIVMNLRHGPAQAADVVLAGSAELLRAEGARAALAALCLPNVSVLRALDFVRRQNCLSRRSLLWNALKIASVARRSGCTHLHAHFAGGAAAHAIVAARWIGASVSFTCHGHDVYAEAEDLPLKLESAEVTVSTCEDMTADLRALAPQASIVTIHYGIDAGQFVPGEDDASNGRLLFVGRLVGQKGIDDLIAALALAEPQVGVDIVGDGPLRAELAALAARLGLDEKRLRFLGARPREWIATRGRSYAGLIAPFKPAPDGSRDSGPIVVKEAMAMQLPVIATRFMGLKQIVTPQTGFQVDVGDIAALAQAMDKLVAMDEAERRRMGIAGRRRLEDMFTIDRHTRQLSRLLEAA